MEQLGFPSLLNCQDKSVITINNSSFRIGRSLSCDHIIQSLEVSRYHCVIKKNHDKWTLFDMSSNGTDVNSTKVKLNESIDLSDGDSIRLGSTDNLFFVFMNPLPVERQDVINTTTSSVFPNNEEWLEQAASLLVDEFEHFENTPPPITTTEEVTSVVVTESSTIANNSEEQSTSNINSQEKKNDNNLNIMENELTCSICSELFIKAVTLNCSHTYCKYCIELWKKTKSNCPICRKPITSVAQTLVLDNFIDRILSTHNDDMRKTRQEIVAQREEATKNAANSSVPSSSAVDTGMDSIIEIYSDDEEDEESDYNYSTDHEYDDHDYDCYDTRSYRSRNNYYGGYGRCFICNESGHWANTCPLRIR